MSTNTRGLTPLELDDLSEQQMAILGPVIERGGGNFNIFKTFIRNPEATQAFLPWGAYVLEASSLTPREREVVILRVGWKCQSEYEWAQHKLIGASVGLTEDDFARLKADHPDDTWSDKERLLIKATDELVDQRTLSAEIWAELSAHYSEKECMDLVFIAGQYVMVAMALNAFNVPLDEGLTGF